MKVVQGRKEENRRNYAKGRCRSPRGRKETMLMDLRRRALLGEAAWTPQGLKPKSWSGGNIGTPTRWLLKRVHWILNK